MNKKAPDSIEIPSEFKRYAKQIRFPGLGIEGQRRLSSSRAIVIGCGALGSVSANLLARAGVGELILIDRDFIELDNLQRQVLYDESDLGQPKAIVAASKLRSINSSIEIDGRIVDVDFRNVENLLLNEKRADIVIDGTDNFEVRFLVNDACVKNEIPWTYAGCLGAEGQVMNVVPGTTPCLNCLMLDGPPPPGTTATCDSGGILSTIINVVAALQVNESLKILSGNSEFLNPSLQVFDLWSNRSHSIDVSGLREKVDCPTCKQKQFVWLNGDKGSQSVILCGRNAVQVSYPDRATIDLVKLAERLQGSGTVETNDFLVRFHTSNYIITVFKDGRAIINGTEEISVAKKLYAQFVGA